MDGVECKPKEMEMSDRRIFNEQRQWLVCRAALKRLAGDDGTYMRLALANIAKWEEGEICHISYARRWREILVMPTSEACKLVLADTHDAAALRQNHPFAGFFSESERPLLRRGSVE
jgi:hypothetical protein